MTSACGCRVDIVTLLPQNLPEYKIRYCNLHLAAGELLAALKAIEDHIGGKSGQCEWDCRIDHKDAYDTEKIQALIARAEGRSSQIHESSPKREDTTE